MGQAPQWLVFRNDGTITAAAYAQEAAVATLAGRAVGQPNFFDRLDRNKPLARRRAFVVRIMRQTMQARSLTYVWACGEPTRDLKSGE